MAESGNGMREKWARLWRGGTSNVLVQLFRYAFVGGGAFVVDYGALWLLADVAHVHYLLSAALAFLMGLTVNYLLSTCWVFDKSRISNVWAEFAVFALIGVVGLGLNELIIYLCTGVWGMWVMLSKIISTGIVFFWNFFARKYILFKSGKE